VTRSLTPQRVILTLTAVDDRNGHQDSGSTSHRAHHIGSKTEKSKGSTSKRGSSGNDPLQFLVDASLTVTGNDHLLVLELLGNLSRSGTGNFDPGLGEDGTGRNDEEDVKDRVKRVEQGRGDGSRSRDVVGETGNGFELTRGFLHGLYGASV